MKQEMDDIVKQEACTSYSVKQEGRNQRKADDQVRLEVGTRVELEWSDGWYPGTVSFRLEMFGEPVYHEVCYDDGDVKCHNLILWEWRLCDNHEAKKAFAHDSKPFLGAMPRTAALASRAATARLIGAQPVPKLPRASAPAKPARPPTSGPPREQIAHTHTHKADDGRKDTAALGGERDKNISSPPRDEGHSQSMNLPREPLHDTETLSRVDRRMDEVRQVLAGMRLEQYAGAFADQGYDDLEYLLTLGQDRLDEVADAIGMKPGHRMKFKTRMLERSGQ